MERLSSLYASALYELSIEREMIEEVFVQADFLLETLNDADVLKVLLHPHIPRADKSRLITGPLEGRIQEDLISFLKLAINKNRQTFIIPALNNLIALIEKHKNIVTAKVITATELDEAQTAELRETLSKRLNKHVRLSVKVDRSVVAGPYIYVDGYYLDWTIKKRISDLTVHMKEGCTA